MIIIDDLLTPESRLLRLAENVPHIEALMGRKVPTGSSIFFGVSVATSMGIKKDEFITLSPLQLKVAKLCGWQLPADPLCYNKLI